MKKLAFLLCLFCLFFITSCNKKISRKAPEGLEYKEVKLELNNIKNINIEIFEKIKEKKIKSYADMQLTIKLEDIDLKSLGDKEQLIKVVNNPEFPDDTKDSVIVTPLKVKNIEGNMVAFKEDKVFSFAITYNEEAEGINLGIQPLFWVFFYDLEKILKSSDFKALTESVENKLKNDK